MNARTATRIVAVAAAALLPGALAWWGAVGTVGWTFYTPTTATVVEAPAWPRAVIAAAGVIGVLAIVLWGTRQGRETKR